MDLPRDRRALVIGSVLAVTLHAFDELSVVTALPVIVDDLGGRSLYGAAFFAYMLTNLVGLVTAGWQATRYGPARPFALGLGVFLAGLALAVVAPSMEVLIAARAVQGLGGGIAHTIVLVVVNRGFSDDERPRVLALVSAAWVVPALVAPAAAGAIAEQLGWRWVFGCIMPLVGIAGLLALPAMRSLGAGAEREGGWRHTAMGVRLACGVGMALAGLGLDQPAIGIALVAGGAALAAGPVAQILPRDMWTGRTPFGASIAFKILVAFAFFGTEAFVPLALVDIHGTSASFAGLALTGAALSWTAGAFLQSRCAASVPARRLAQLGAVGVLIGIAVLFAVLDPQTAPALALIAWTVAGAGMGIAYNTASVTAMAQTADGDEGPTSTALGVSDALGISIATGIGGALVNLGDRSDWTTSDSLALVWIAMAAVACVSFVAALRMPGTASAPAPTTLDPARAAAQAARRL